MEREKRKRKKKEEGKVTRNKISIQGQSEESTNDKN